MTSEIRTRQQSGSWGIKWYHFAFALALGVGAGVFPPTGVVTPVGWVAAGLGSVVSVAVLSGVVLFAVRWADDWRPSDLSETTPPDSRFKYLIFTTIGAQLFVLGTALSAGLQASTTLIILSPLNVLLAGFILGDLLRLRTRGIEWRPGEFAYFLAALVFGALGGLVYWYRRGRKRFQWAQADARTETADEDDTEESIDLSEADNRSASPSGETASEHDATAPESANTRGKQTESSDAGETPSAPPEDSDPEASGSDSSS